MIRTPNVGDVLSAAWARDLVEEVRSHRLNVCPPLKLTRTPTGTTLRMPLARSGSSGETTGKAWDISLSAGGLATFTACCYQRGPVFWWVGDITDQTITPAADDADTWVSAQIDVEDGTVTIVSGAASACYDFEPPENDNKKQLKPLYILGTHTDAETGETTFTLKTDLRTCLSVVLYI